MERASFNERYTTVGGRDFRFAFVRQSSGGYRIYIEGEIDYGGRATDLHSTHRHRDSSRYYVCWDGDPLTTEGAARHVAGLWADATEDYIRFGTRF